MSPKLLNQTIEAIEELSQEREKLAHEVEQAQEKLAHLQKAQELSVKLLDQGALPVEYFRDKLAEFSEKSTQELDLIEKAASLNGGASLMSSQIGSLSDHEDVDTLDPITRCLLEDTYY